MIICGSLPPPFFFVSSFDLNINIAASPKNPAQRFLGTVRPIQRRHCLYKPCCILAPQSFCRIPREDSQDRLGLGMVESMI